MAVQAVPEAAAPAERRRAVDPAPAALAAAAGPQAAVGPVDAASAAAASAEGQCTTLCLGQCEVPGGFSDVACKITAKRLVAVTKVFVVARYELSNVKVYTNSEALGSAR